MANSYAQKLEFIVDDQPADTFAVFRMSGREAISEMFRFEVDLVSDDPNLSLDALAGKDATLTVTRLEQTRKVHGMLESIELHAATPRSHYIYKAVLVPRLQRLELSRQNQIHGTAVPVSVREVLTEQLSASNLKGGPASSVSGRLNTNDFELRLSQTYPKRDYIVQHDESDLSFISRLCEHYGIFYYFTHDSGRDIAVFGDYRVAFPQIGGPGNVAYRPASGLTNAGDAAVFRFSGRSSLLPSQICLRDYNYRTPNLTLEVSEPVDPKGHGVVVEFGAHFRTPQEGRDLARVRAQELLCRKQVFQGESDDVHMIAGGVFSLTGHFRNGFNAGYLLTWVEHEATQALPGIADFTGPGHQSAYRNRFGCLPKTVDFRPVRRTPKPRMSGLSNAVVDAAGSGQRAELDATGRYKIRQQFDQRGEAAGQASRYMRKSEPYGGVNSGMHFPLLKGTEVILACVNGDPDRPVIVGAMQNEPYPSVVNAQSNTKNRMRTTAGTLFEIDDGPASGGGGSGASSGATLAPQRALEGPALERPTVTQSLATQRPESSTESSSGATSSYARLQVTAGTDSYWRLGSKPTDSTEDSRTADMSNMTGGDDAGDAGFFEYTAGDRTSLIDGASYSQVGANRLDYVVADRRMSATNHFTVAKTQYQVIAQGVSIEASKATLTDNSVPATATKGNVDIVAAAAANLKTGTDYIQTVGGKLTIKVTGDVSIDTSGNMTLTSHGDMTLKSHGDMTMDADGSITLNAGGSMTMDADGSMTAKAGGSTTVKAGSSMTISSGTGLTGKAGTALDLQGGTTMSIKGSASGTVDGGGALTVKGGIINLN
jgi:type VI secretion system VgrG family protein